MSRKQLSVILPLQENSRGFPVAFIDWDNALRESGVDYELILVGSADDNRIKTIRKSLRSSVSGLIFVTSESKKIEDLIESGVNKASKDNIILASPEVFIKSEDLDKLIQPIISGDTDLVFSYSGDSNPIAGILYKTFSPIGSCDFERCIVAMKRDAMLSLLPTIKMFSWNVIEGLAMTLKKRGIKISETELDASLTPNLAENSFVSRFIKIIKTRLVVEMAWIKQASSIYLHNNRKM